MNENINLDSSNGFTYITDVAANQEIAIELYFHNTGPAPLLLSDGNGSSMLQAIRIG